MKFDVDYVGMGDMLKKSEFLIRTVLIEGKYSSSGTHCVKLEVYIENKFDER